MLDGVFDHGGCGLLEFNQILENGRQSPVSIRSSSTGSV